MESSTNYGMNPNRRHQGSDTRPEFVTPGLVETSPLTSVDPLDKHERVFVWKHKVNMARYFTSYQEQVNG